MSQSWSDATLGSATQARSIQTQKLRMIQGGGIKRHVRKNAPESRGKLEAMTRHACSYYDLRIFGVMINNKVFIRRHCVVTRLMCQPS